MSTTSTLDTQQTQSSNLTRQVQDTLGSYSAWEQRCQEGNQIMVDGKLCGPDDVMQVCEDLDCFGDNAGMQKPLPRAQIDAWQAACQNCKNSQKNFRRQHPMLESIWEMGQVGVVECQDGLTRLSRGRQISQDQEPILFSTLTRYLPNAALQAEHAVRVKQKSQSENRQRFERLMEPFGFSLNGSSNKVLAAGDRRELEGAIYRLQTLQSMNGDDYDHQALHQKLSAIRKDIGSNIERLESTKWALAKCIDEAVAYHDSAAQKQAMMHRQQRREKTRHQFEENLMREIGSSSASEAQGAPV